MTLFRCAEKAGATGSITFAGVGLSEAYRLELTPSGSSLKVRDEDLEGSPEVLRVCRIALERDEAAQATRRSKKKRAEAVPVPTTSPATKSVTHGEEERGPSAEEGQAALEEIYTRLAKADVDLLRFGGHLSSCVECFQVQGFVLGGTPVV